MAKKGKVVASIEARYSASRLPGKVLKEIMGVPMLELLIERVRKASLIDEIIIATSTNPKDDALEQLARKIGVACFRGSEEDVLARVLGAVCSVKGDHIVELWGDNALMDPKIIDEAISLYMNSDFDCVGTLEKCYPLGMGVLIFPTKILAEVDRITNDPVDRENVSNYIYEHPQKYTISNLTAPPHLYRPTLRLTIDELPDFEFVTRIFETLRPKNHFFDTKDILDFVDSNPQLLKINQAVRQKVLRAQ
jgi:spore coat polysaccharide biosynthesis protein SpsF